MSAKPRVKCRFCQRILAVRSGDPRQYKPTFMPHKCSHGCDCIGGSGHASKGYNWAAIFIGNPPKFVRGCVKCYADQQAEAQARAALARAKEGA